MRLSSWARLFSAPRISGLGTAPRSSIDGASTFSDTPRLDIGPIEISKDTKHGFPLSPILGVAALAGGIVLIVANTRKS